jgi:hypothetical protein
MRESAVYTTRTMSARAGAKAVPPDFSMNYERRPLRIEETGFPLR